jgi:nitrite reductase/ring-hydroxylating ferredoxin subunit/uncharacterized membrane protein
VLRRLLDAPTSWSLLDAVASPVRRAVHMVPDPVRRVLHGTWLGHPVHPIAAQVTVACYASAAIVDVVARLGRPDRRAGIRDASTALLTVGVASSGATTASGLADWSQLRPEQQRLGLTHAALTGVATLAAAAVLAGRRADDAVEPGRPVGSLAVAGVVAAGAALGGHLSYRWGAGANHADGTAVAAPSDWTDVGGAGDFPEGVLIRRQAGAVDVLLVRHHGEVHALAERCSHLGGPLADGQVRTVDGRVCVVCPWHGSAFPLVDGRRDVSGGQPSVAGPAIYPQPRFAVREQGLGDAPRVLVRIVPDVTVG